MNTANALTAESLNSLSRKALIAVAIEHAIEKPYTTKSATLVEAILNAQPNEAVEITCENVEPITNEAETEVEFAEPASAQIAEPVADNVIPFDAGATEQTEIPEEAVPAVSRGIFKIGRKTFQRQLAAAARITAASTSMPILACVLIKFGSGELAIEANDLSNHLRTVAQAETTESCSIAIPHKLLSKFVGRCSSEFLMAEVFGEKLVISDLENRTEIMGIPASEFPPAHPSVDVAVMEIAGKQLARVINETVKAASTDETRYVINGLGIDTKEGHVLSTDGRRLVRASLGAEGVTPLPVVVILPTHAALVLASGVPQDVTVKVTTSERNNHLRFVTESVGFTYSLTSRLVDGRYPDCSKIVPTQNTGSFDVSNPELKAALGRLLVVANASGKECAVKFEFGVDTVTMNAVNVSVGSGKETVTVRSSEDSAPRFIALNGDYLNEIVCSWADESLSIHVTDGSSPFVIRTADKVAVIMPVRLS